jgi:3-methyladenine DNA glycosylase AlkD
MTEFAARIERQLSAAGDPDRAEHERRYLKSRLEHLGVSVPAIRRIARDSRREAGGLPRDALLATVEALWARPVHECRMSAVELLELGADELVPEDVGLVERLIRESGTWALVDGLAASVTAPLVERDPELGAVLDRWAVDEDFWLRRSALLALLPPLRRGGGDFARFGRYAEAMLGDREPFIRKAIGWVLRDTAKRRPELVAAWLVPRAARASGVTVREAVRHLPPDRRRPILDRHRRALDAPRP